MDHQIIREAQSELKIIFLSKIKKYNKSYDFTCFNMGHFNQAIAILAAIMNSKMDPRFENYIIIHHNIKEWMPR